MWGPSKIAIEQKLATTPTSEWVVLLDGIGPNFFQMKWMAGSLNKAGFNTALITYPSTRYPIETLVSDHIGPALKAALPADHSVVHFVVLSMGGIIVRAMMRSEHRPDKLGRVVMLAPPNQGSETADFLKNWFIYRWGMGPAGQELTTAADSVPNTLGPADFDVGILTGYWSYDPWFYWLFSGPNDGKVAVERAKLEGMRAFKSVPASHYDIMLRKSVQADTVHFLRQGTFAA